MTAAAATRTTIGAQDRDEHKHDGTASFSENSGPSTFRSTQGRKPHSPNLPFSAPGRPPPPRGLSPAAGAGFWPGFAPSSKNLYYWEAQGVGCGARDLHTGCGHALTVGLYLLNGNR